jgi:hypothetical protein
MKVPKNYLSNRPLLALIAANVIPLFGAIFWNWNTFNIVFLYWAENLATGFYTILKIAFLPVPDPAQRRSLGELVVKICLILPFTIHYGLFVVGHGLVVLTFFGKEKAGSVMSPYMIGTLTVLFLSHGVSFVRNYLIGGEYASVNLLKLMITGPYSRVVVMHIAVMAGAFGVMMLGSPLGGLAVLIVLKTAMDAKLHLWEHKKAKPHARGRTKSRVNKDGASIEQGGTKMAGKEALVVASRVKAYIKSRNMMTSSDAIAALSDKVRAILDKAVARAKANRRWTVKPWDL